MLPRRGDIYLVDFEPARANEANKQRPAIIVTNNAANVHGSSVVVIPLSSNTRTVYPFQVLLPVNRTELQADSKAQTELIRSVSRERLLHRLSFVPDDLMVEIDSSIQIHLGLNIR
jgi:mRNA interferase MazF